MTSPRVDSSTPLGILHTNNEKLLDASHESSETRRADSGHHLVPPDPSLPLHESTHADEAIQSTLYTCTSEVDNCHSSKRALWDSTNDRKDVSSEGRGSCVNDDGWPDLSSRRSKRIMSSFNLNHTSISTPQRLANLPIRNSAITSPSHTPHRSSPRPAAPT